MAANQAPLFRIRIADGHIFKAMLAIAKQTVGNTSMILSPDKIEISFMNEEKTVVHIINLKTRKLLYYQYDAVDENTGGLAPEFAIAFSTEQFFNSLHEITKNDGFELAYYKGDPQIYIRIIRTSAQTNTRAGAAFLNLVNLEHYRLGIASGYPEKPNVSVLNTYISEVFKRTTSAKAKCLHIVGGPDYVKFNGLTAENTELFTETVRNNIYIGTNLPSFRPALSPVQSFPALPSPETNGVHATENGIVPLNTPLSLPSVSVPSSSQYGTQVGVQMAGQPMGPTNTSAMGIASSSSAIVPFAPGGTVEPAFPSTGRFKLNIVNSTDIIWVKVPTRVIKILAKIKDTTGKFAMTEFYFHPSNPIMMRSPIGYSGKYTLCLRNGAGQ